MNSNENDRQDAIPGELPARMKWRTPTLTRLRSGAAENTPGTRILDGPLETMGS